MNCRLQEQFAVGPPVVPVGLPSVLLRRRPDICRAEALHGATAHIGIATADLFPKFSLTWPIFSGIKLWVGDWSRWTSAYGHSETGCQKVTSLGRSDRVLRDDGKGPFLASLIMRDQQPAEG